MISAIVVIYILLWVRSHRKISRIENPIKTKGSVTGFEIIADKKKKWIRDIVSFSVGDNVFMATNSSSPFYLSGKSPAGQSVEVVYNEKNPNENIVVDNTVFVHLRTSVVVLASIYFISFVVFVLWF